MRIGANKHDKAKPAGAIDLAGQQQITPDMTLSVPVLIAAQGMGLV